MDKHGLKRVVTGVTKQQRNRWCALLASALGLIFTAQAHSASNAEQLRDLDNTWTDAGLGIELVTEDQSNVVIADDELRYRLTARQAGACYIVHVDAEDKASLLRPADCSALGQGDASYFPSAGSLRASEPWGEEAVFAFMLDNPLPAAETLLDGTQGFVALQDESAVTDLISALEEASASGQLAMAETQYNVMQYRTRGIIKAVSAASRIETADKEVSFSAQSINFAFGSDELTEAGAKQLDEFGKALADPQLTAARLKVAGHTDDLGEELYNQDLSERRAATVARYLKDNFDIDSERVDIVGMGESTPLVPDTSREARAKNRRVEMIIIN